MSVAPVRLDFKPKIAKFRSFKLRWKINNAVKNNSFDYFEKTLITDNGFREYDVRWLIEKEINPNGFVVLGRAYGTFIQEIIKENNVIVGHDFRSYSQELCRSLIVGLLSAGIHVIDIGLSLTPMVYFAQHYFNTKGGAMVTASHNENGWTGIKLADGLSSTLGPAGISKYKEIVKSNNFMSGSGSYESIENLFEVYSKDILSGNKLKQKRRIVLACGNGTAGRFAPSIIRSLGCELVEVDCDGNWDFPNHNPNPENIAFLKKIRQVTLDSKADLGIGLDGDGDRIGVVDERGREIFSDKLGFLLSRWISERHPDRSLVIDVKSTGLFFNDDILEKNSMNVVMWKTGHSYIKKKVAEIDAIAGFEKSGHFFFNTPYGRGYDDALVAAVILLNFLDDSDLPLSEIVDSLPKTWQSPSIGAICPDEKKYDVVANLTEQYVQDQENAIKIAGRRIKDIITVNGVRFVLENDSWGLVRASSNKPSLVLVAESQESEDELRNIINQIQKRLDETGMVHEYDQQLPDR